VFHRTGGTPGTIFCPWSRWSGFLTVEQLEQFFANGAVFRQWSSFWRMEQVEQFDQLLLNFN
jgi:hypothetical protein